MDFFEDDKEKETFYKEHWIKLEGAVLEDDFDQKIKVMLQRREEQVDGSSIGLFEGFVRW